MGLTGKKISELDATSLAALKEASGVNDLIALTNQWDGKTIVWLGTSVPLTGYPTTVGGLLNATVVNKAIGGSVVKKGANGETQYGLSSDSELDTIPANMLDFTFRHILDNDGDSLWTADLFVLDHGHNDHGTMDSYKVDGTLTLTSENAFDRDWMVGGLNHIITEILKVNTYARFCIVNEYRYGAFDNKDANQLVADYWGIPILNWELGVRNFNPNSKLGATVLKYYTGTELAGGTDYIHPGTHLKAIMATKLASWLRTIV